MHGIENTIRILQEIILYLAKHKNEETGILDLVNALGYHHQTIQRNIRALEKMGYVEIIPKIRKNTIHLTRKGWCLARCILEDFQRVSDGKT